MTIKDRILTFLKEQSISREDFYRSTELSASNFKGAALKSELGGDKIVKILTTYRNLSSEWLLIGEGSMLKQNVQNEIDSTQTTENALISSDKDKQNSSINQEETSYIYKMYQEEKADWKTEKREKDSKIDHLQSELRSMEKELAVLKALHSQSQDKEPEHHSSVDKPTETFTSDLSGDYGEGFLPTSPPTKSSTKLSAGKI